MRTKYSQKTKSPIPTIRNPFDFFHMKRFAIIAALLLSSAYLQAQQRWGVVSLSTAFLRNAPDYEAPLETQALMGSTVEVTGEQGYWKSVSLQNPSYEAWVTDLGIVEMSRDDFEEYSSSPKYICTAMQSRVFSRPSPRSSCLSDLVAGDILRKGISRKGSIASRGRFVPVLVPDGRQGWVLSRDVEDLGEWAASSSLTPESIMKTACNFLGTPYMWGGNSSKYVDCSGLVWMVYFLNGAILPRNASQQAHLGMDVALNDAAPGDLMFFGTAASADKPERISHVGIYLGDGKIIHASQVVRIGSVRPSDDDYIGRQPVRVRRITSSDEGVVRISEDIF